MNRPHWHSALVPQWFEQQFVSVLHAAPADLQLVYTHSLFKHWPEQQSDDTEQSALSVAQAPAHF
jgi:hypothetical protein